MTSGELKRLIDEDGLRGMTSNPSIFEKAIAGSTRLRGFSELAAVANRSRRQGALRTARHSRHSGCRRLLRAGLRQHEERDGYVSLEVSPYLARDTQGTIDEARRLWKAVARPNVMIKVPGTSRGHPGDSSN